MTVALAIMAKDTPEKLSRAIRSAESLVDHVLIQVAPEDPLLSSILEWAPKDTPLAVAIEPWVDYGHNRNTLLTRARKLADWIIVLDADDELSGHLPNLDQISEDALEIPVTYGSYSFYRPHVLRSSADWAYAGRVHEALTGSGSTGRWDGLQYVVHAASDRPGKYEEYVRLLKDDPSPRGVFYLAQSYKDLNMWEEALEAYSRRASMGGWHEEVFHAALWAGRIADYLGQPWGRVFSHFIKAEQAYPGRAETWFHAAKAALNRGHAREGRSFAAIAMRCKLPHEAKLFVDRECYTRATELHSQAEAACSWQSTQA